MYFNLISLGCDKTLVDSEHIIGALESAGFLFTEDIEEADLIAINTCCFIGDALFESIQTVLDVALKKREDAKIAVFGCMAKRFYEDIMEELPEADILIISCDPSDIAEILAMEFEDELKASKEKSKDTESEPKVSRKLTGPGYFSYLKIADGCNKNCSYCVIPGIRGRYKSLPKEELLAEARELAHMGVKELNIVAQETTLYGVDLYGHKCLHELLREISEIEGIKWIRLLYAYPEEIYPELISEIKNNPKILHYIDMPIQHCNDRILKLMGRNTTKQTIIDKIGLLRDEIPDICIRTTLITGFPSETEDEHQELLDFIEEYNFDRLGVFKYSQEEGTKAAELDGQIDEEIKDLRFDELMSLQAKKSESIGATLTGKTLKAIIEGKIVDEDVWQARTYRDAPDIDGLVFFNSDTEYISGDFVNLKITETNGYDLIGNIAGE